MSQRGKQNTKSNTQQKSGQPQQQQQKNAQPVVQTLETLISSLLDQGFELLEKKDIPQPDKKTKTVSVLVTSLTTKLKSPKNHTDLPKDAISLTLALQMNSGLTGPNSKKVMSHIFTFLIEELDNWEEYGVDKNDVHPDV